jgi:hypothetical protein
MESSQHREPWNKGKLVGQKPPLKPKDIWAIRILSGIWKAIRLDPTGSTSDNIDVIAFETLKGKSWLGQTPSSPFSRNTMCVT